MNEKFVKISSLEIQQMLEKAKIWKAVIGSKKYLWSCGEPKRPFWRKRGKQLSLSFFGWVGAPQEFRSRPTHKGCPKIRVKFCGFFFMRAVSGPFWEFRWDTAVKMVLFYRRQRLAMVRNTEVIGSLVKALDGFGFEAKTALEVDAWMSQQYLVLDLLMWIIHQGTTDNR